MLGGAIRTETDLQLIKAYALTFMGTPYLWGGPNRYLGLDCSQFVTELLIAAGMLPHKSDFSSAALFDKFKACADTRDLGALAFYGPSINQINHVAFLLDNLTIIESAGGGSANTNIEISKKAGAGVRIRPLLYRQDFIAVKMPSYKRG